MKSLTKKLQHYLAAGLLLAVIATGIIGVKNSAGVQAATQYPYLIKVNRQMCTVTIYEQDSKGNYTVPIKAMLCSPGYETPLGTFKTPAKYRWKLLMDDVWGQYSTRVVNGILFHSVWYYEQDPATLSNKQFNKLGTICSHGCIRLTVEDAKWIYDNCPIGTTVVIYDSPDPGPLGKPEGIKVSEKTLMGYDPTDIWSEGNPYVEAKPVISGTGNKTIDYGESVDLMEGVTAKTSTGEDITEEIKITIKYQNETVKKVKTKKAGNYYITYSVTDKLGKTAEKEVVYTVVDNAAPKIKGLKDTYLNTELDKDAFNETVVVKWHGKEVNPEDVVIIWKTVREKEDIKKYKVTYIYTAPNGKSVKKSAKVICDLKAPEFIGVADGMVVSEEKLTRKFLLSSVTAMDNVDGYIMEEKVEVTVEKQEDGTFKAVYKVADTAGNVTVEEAVYSIIQGISITGVKEQVVSAEQVVDESFVLKGVKAYENGIDISEKITVVITPVEGGYQVNYKVVGADGVIETAFATFTVEAEEVQ